MAEKQQFGPNTPAVLEVIEFASARRILSKPFQAHVINDFETEVVYSLDTVYRFRYGQHLPNPDRWSTVERWFDIKGADMQVFDVASEEVSGYWSTIRPLIVSKADEVLDWLTEQLSSLLPRREIEHIADDLEMIMAFRAVFGHNSLLYERLFRVYCAYGHPCGWIGSYPDGRLIVYSR